MKAISHHNLPSLSVLSFRGSDALRFLHGQLTADVAALAAGEARLAAWCNAQGRVLAVPWLVGGDDRVLAVLPHELAADVADGLRRYVLRAKVSVSDESGTLSVAGIAGTASVPVAAGAVAARLPGDRALLIGPPAALAAACAGLQAGDESAWWAMAIRRGEPVVTLATRGAWIPQMLNLDLVGAVSFAKGCYPGQEIVARAHHLGRVKRRMARYRIEGEGLPAPGAALLHDGVKVAELVVAAGGDPPEALAVVELEALGRPLADERGARRFVPAPLPYAVPGPA